MLRSLKFRYHRFTGAFLVFLFISSIFITLFPFPEAKAADPTQLDLKWTGYVAGGGEALLTYDVLTDPAHPGEEIFHAGGGPKPQDATSSVTCLNGRTGAVIWKTGQGGLPAVNGIGDTCQAQMVDMDNDGDMELVVPLQSPAGLVILNAEDGTVMFSDTSLGGGRIDASPVAGDIDNDGYPDLYVGIMAYVTDPSTGHIIHYEYDPGSGEVEEIQRRVVWHPCAGGLSLADTDNDGRYELYMADRSQGGMVDGSWGRGLRSFWADDLTSRWDVYDNMMSSNIPMLADVNKDGILDIVATDLSRAVLVLDSATGHPLVNDEGTVLRESIRDRANHYQSSVYDTDGDGNLEIISADGFEGSNNYFTVWDLWDWTLDAHIDTTIVGPVPTRSWKGPTVGEVTGDGNKDIIVTTFDPEVTNNGQVQVYSYNGTGYELVLYRYGLRHRAIDSVVQDVDRDDGGLNELLILTQGGVIYCFDTAGLSEEHEGRPRARSEVQFYSQRRNGASEYVPYEYVEQAQPNSRASVAFPSPDLWEFGVSTSVSGLSFTLNHPLDELMDYEVSYWAASDPGTILGSDSGTGVGNGVQTLSLSGLESSTTYGWHVEVTDESGHVTTKEYAFSTSNSVPTQGSPVLSGGSELETLVATPTSIPDGDGDEVTYVYRWTKDGTSIANLIMPFDTMTDPESEYRGHAYTYDYSGSSNDGDVFGASWIDQGKVGGAYSLDGSNDFIRIEEQGSSLGGNGNWDEITVEFWVQATEDTPSSGGGGWYGPAPLIEKHGRPVNPDDASQLEDPIFQYTGYQVDLTSDSTTDTITWHIYTENPSDEENPIHYQVSANIGAYVDWHHVVCTYTSGDGLKIYADGAEVNSLLGVSGNILETNVNSNSRNLGDFVGDWGHTTGGSVGINKGPLEIGSGGIIDELKIYPSEISADQVFLNYMDTVDGLSTQSRISPYETQPEEQWRCYVTPNDGLTDGSTMPTNTVTISDVPNNVPVASNLVITAVPDPAVTGSDLVANYDYFDADGHPEVGSIIEWYNGGILSATGPVLLSTMTAKGESWTFTVTPSDGFDFGIEAGPSAPVTIENTAPSFESVVISPDPAFPVDTLTANSYGFSDPDADAVEGYTYQWQKLNGAVWEDISGATSQTLVPANFVADDYIRVNVTVTDGEDPGNMIAAEKWIVDSAPPTMDTPVLASGSGLDRGDDELTCHAVNPLAPEGGERVITIYNWLKAGTSYTNLYLPFETNSKILATDYSGYGNDGEVYGATWESDGAVGGAYSFGSSDYILVNEQSDSLGSDGTWSAISVEFWVLMTNNGMIVSLHDADYSTGGYMGDPYGVGYNAYSNRGRFYWSVYTDDGSGSVQFSDSDNLNMWHHVVGTYDGAEVKLYLDGFEVATTALTGDILETTESTLYIGGSDSGGGFSGLLDEVKIYPHALSAAQVFQNYVDSVDGLSDEVTIVPQETTSGETWRCEVTPNDGWQDGTSELSNQLTLTSDNTVPRIDIYSPVDSLPYVLVGDSLDFMVVCSDPDTSSLTFEWTLDGEIQVDAVSNDLDSTWTYSPSTASIHTVGVTITDGSDTDYLEWSVDVGTPVPQYTLTVEIVGGVGGSVTLDPAGGTYDEGTVVDLTAVADTGYEFSVWGGDASGTELTTSVTMDSDKTVTATFIPIEYTLTITVVGTDCSVTKLPDQATYHYGDIVTLTPNPALDWTFVAWSEDVDSTEDPLTIIINGTTSITATFTDQYVLTLNVVGNGEVTLDPDQLYYAPGTEVDLTAAADLGWTFAGWSGDASGSELTTTITMDGHKTVTATFTQDEYTLTVTPVGSGSVSKNPDQATYHYGDVVTLTPSAAAGWTFDSWSGGASGSDDPLDLTILGNTAVTATFTQDEYTLTINIDGSGTVDALPDQATYHYGDMVTLTANPAAGMIFGGWSGDLSGSSNPVIITMDGDKTVTATFTLPYLFADGYESGNFDEWTGTGTESGSAAVTSTVVYGGVYSGEFNIDTGTAGTTRRAYSYIDLDDLDEAYAWAYVYIPSGISLDSGQKLFVIQFEDTASSPLGSYGVIADGSGIWWAVQYAGYPSAIGASGPSGGGWYLLEAYFTHAASGPTLTLSVDDVEVASLEWDTSSSSAVASARFGIGYYTGAPAITVYVDDAMVNDGPVTSPATEQNAYLAVRGSDDAIYYRLYDKSADSWNSWVNLPSGSTSKEPACAVANGKLYFIVCGSDGYSLWFSNVNLEDEAFSGWTMLEGSCASPPTLTSNGTHLALVVRGMDNVVYYCVYDTEAESWSGWTGLPGTTCSQPTAAMVGDELHVMVRGYSTVSEAENMTLWHSIVNLNDNSFSAWTAMIGSSDAAPTLAASAAGNVYVSVKGEDNLIYVNEWTGSWQGWTALESGSTMDSPAIAVTDNVLQFVVKGADGFSLWYCTVDLNTSDQSAWEALTGSSPSAPTLCS